MTEYEKSLIESAKKLNNEFKNGNYDPLPYEYEYETDWLNINEYLHLYDILDGLSYDYYIEFPMLNDVKRICYEHIKEVCSGGK